MTIRPVIAADAPAIGAIAEAGGLFSADMAVGMLAPAMAGAPDLWRVAIEGDVVTGFAFARPETLTDAVWNLLALAVAPRARRGGLGRALTGAIEAAAGARMMIVETTQLPAQAPARALYARLGYQTEGRVRDFYAVGEDKVILRKVLA